MRSRSRGQARLTPVAEKTNVSRQETATSDLASLPSFELAEIATNSSNQDGGGKIEIVMMEHVLRNSVLHLVFDLVQMHSLYVVPLDYSTIQTEKKNM